MPAANSKDLAIGIDLGTTFSVICKLDDLGRPQTLINAEGDKITPSVVFFEGDNVVVGKGDVVAQFRQVCANIQAVMSAAGGEMTDIVKLTIYVLDVADYKQHLRELGAVYREYFPTEPPARATVQVVGLALGARIEIEVTAAR